MTDAAENEKITPPGKTRRDQLSGQSAAAAEPRMSRGSAGSDRSAGASGCAPASVQAGAVVPAAILDFLPELSQDILAWYDKNARTLPWRGERDAYRIWVSEIMLQQTRVEAVIPYYERFLTALPDVASLARATDETLHKLWEGLGYYSRVLNMKKAAGILSHDGVFPSSFEQLLRLPGFGRYTAGAVASIAFNQPVPAVDGNVLRVLARITMSFTDISGSRTKKAFEALAGTMLIPARSGDFNQALMELGATVCLPGARARCAECPAQQVCLSRQHGCVQSLPISPRKKPRTATEHTALILISPRGVLIRQRAKTGLLAGLWELPCIDGQLSRKQAVDEMEKLGADIRGLVSLQPYRHIFTHAEWHMHGFAATTRGFMAAGFVWADERELKDRYALPSALKPYVRLLGALIESARTDAR